MKHEEDLFSGVDARNVQFAFQQDISGMAVMQLDEAGVVIQLSEHFNRWINDRCSIKGTNILQIEGNSWLKSVFAEPDICKGRFCTGELYFEQQLGPLSVALYAVKMSGENGQPVTYVCIISRNTPSLSQALEAEKLLLIAEHAGDVFSLHSLNGDLIYTSRSCEKLHGYASEEITGQQNFNLLHPDDRSLILEVIEKIKENTISVKIQYRVIHKRGHILWVESAYKLIRENDIPKLISVITRDITGSKLLEDSLRKSEEKYRTLVKSLPTGILLLNTRGEILEINQALLDILGSPGEEPTKMINLFEFENLISAGISQELQRCITEKKTINGQAEYLSKWGKKSYLLYGAVPVFDSGGEVIQVICNVRDITRVKRAEEKSQQQIDFLNLVINTMQEPFFVKDENHRWIMLNDAAVEMMGQQRESLIGKSDYELYPKEQADVFWEKDAFALEHGSNVNEERITWSDGSERIIITNKQLYTEALTNKKYIVGTIHDITELRASEARITESQQRYHELFDNANDHIFTTDLNGNFTNANKAMLDIMGIPLEELNNHTIYSFVKPEILENLKKVTHQLLKDGKVDPFEVETLEKDGKAYTLEVQARLIYKDGRPFGLQGIARDISDKKQASQKLELINRELQEINASKDKFYSIIAHDLKNPFNSLIGFSELLLEEYDELSRDEMRDYVGIIRNTAKNSLILLENLLAWSRLQTGRMIYNPVKLSLSAEVDATATVLFSLSYRKKLQVENRVDRQIMVVADQNMLLSILHNLMMNAIKFTASNGSIVIDCKATAHEITGIPMAEVSVSDTGVGMTEENLSKLFSISRPFTMPGTEKEMGTGLGLLLVKEMVEKHGGVIKVISQAGKGSTFSFQIPLFVP